MSEQIISLQNSIDAWSRQEALLVKALDCYSRVIEDLERCVFRYYPQKFGEPAPDFAADRVLLQRLPSATQLDETRRRLSEVLAGTALRVEGRLAGCVELGEVLSILSATVERLRDGNATQEVRLRGVTGALASAVAVEDLASFRTKVVSQLGILTKLVETMRDENRQILVELEGEMADYRRKLDDARRLSRTDWQTGLANRAELENRIQEYLETGLRFSLVVLCVQRVDIVSEKYGPATAAALVAAVAARVQRHLLPGEVAAFGGTEVFLVLVPAPSGEAMTRSRVLQGQLAGEYRLASATGSLRLPVAVNAGVAEARRGDTHEKILSRVDALVYCQQPQL